MHNAFVLAKRNSAFSLIPGSKFGNSEALLLLSITWQLNSNQVNNYAEPNAHSTTSGLPSSATFLIDREIKKLRTFCDLPVGWDSYNGLPASVAAVEQAISILESPSFLYLLPINNPRVAAFPLSSGGIQLDLNGGKVPLEIMISARGEAEFTFFGLSNEVLWEGYSLDEAVAWYTEFFSNQLSAQL